MEENIEEVKKDKFFVQLRGGTEEEREGIKKQLQGFSAKSESDVDLVNVDSNESELSIHIETPCGSVDLSKSDLDHDGVMEAACKSVSCTKPMEDVAEPPTMPESEKKLQAKEEIPDDVISGTEGNGES